MLLREEKVQFKTLNPIEIGIKITPKMEIIWITPSKIINNQTKYQIIRIDQTFRIDIIDINDKISFKIPVFIFICLFF